MQIHNRMRLWIFASIAFISKKQSQAIFSDSSGKSVKAGSVARNACRVELKDDFHMLVVDDDFLHVAADELLDFGNVSGGHEVLEFRKQLAERFSEMATSVLSNCLSAYNSSKRAK